MTNEKILKKAIEKAGLMNTLMPGDSHRDCRFKNYYDIDWKCLVEHSSYYPLIFSHSFAKAFWGKECFCEDCSQEYRMYSLNFPYLESIERWQYHLQQLVLEEEPLKYLEKFL